MNVLYTTHCPRCKVLKMKLDNKNIEYIENEDKDEMMSKGFKTAPVLEIDGSPMEFSKAIAWIEAQ